MARAPRSSFNALIFSVLSVAFGLVALTLTYKAATDSTESRSKAAVEGIMVKQWEYNSAGSFEGWSGRYLTDLSVKDGYLWAVLGRTNKAARIRNTQTQAKFEQGNKYLKISLAVVPGPTRVSPVTESVATVVMGQKGPVDAADEDPKLGSTDVIQNLFRKCTPPPGCGSGKRDCPLPDRIPSEGYCPPQNQRSFTFFVLYRLSGKSQYEKTLTFTGVADGRLREYTVNFPEIGPMTINRVQIHFVRGIQPKDKVQVDWLRFYSVPLVRPSPQPTAPSGCRYEHVQCVKEPCDPILICQTPIPSASPSKPPPVGCYYQQVQCVRAPCDPILVCPTGAVTPPPCCSTEQINSGYRCMPGCPSPVVARETAVKYVCLSPDQANSREDFGCPDVVHQAQ